LRSLFFTYPLSQVSATRMTPVGLRAMRMGFIFIFVFFGVEVHASAFDDNLNTEEQLHPDPSKFVSGQRKAERLYYLEAQKSLDKKQLNRYQQILPKLKNYPLTPYVVYDELIERLTGLPRLEVEKFFENYPNSFLGERLRHRWLRTLASQELWADYLKAYDDNLSDPELACLSLRARLATNDKTALQDVEPLWNIEKPQSKACDPVFSEWKESGLLTAALLWERHAKAVRANELALASSLAQEMAPTQQAFAVQYQNVAQAPRLVLQTEYFNTQHAEVRSTLELGLTLYSETDAVAALELWKTYSRNGSFSEEESTQINYAIARQLMLQDRPDVADQLVSSLPNLSHEDLLEALIRDALRKQDWSKTYQWIQRLPNEIRNSERWSYWSARAMEELKIKEGEGKKPTDIYVEVANARSFYGFLSADRLGASYCLVDRPLSLSKEFIKSVELNPGIQRAREFYLLNDFSAASREWMHTMRYLPEQELVAAGRLADSWGWHRQAIQTMSDAQLWNELQIRFPIVNRENVKNAARQTSLNEHYIYAVTRQESAFKTDAKSPSGAIGLMQLLPATAKAVAKKSGLSFKQKDLLEPEKNITLGSRYLSQLLSTFDGNRILATAAYNAGPTRVKKWLNKEDNHKLAYDVWIETIPYKETRNYVQNIMAFSVIYGYRMGSKQSFVTQAEASKTL
jgi:soluble lytic murein transglycosylase